MSKDNGGSAFPSSYEQHIDGWSGMTLRDYFAAKALDIAKDWEEISPTFGGDDGTYKGIAVRAYRMADAMLAERNK